MKQARKHNDKPIHSEFYGRLSHSTLWISVMFLTLISYFAETRPFISSSFGSYLVGFLDGILMMIFAVTCIFYLWSKIGK